MAILSVIFGMITGLYRLGWIPTWPFLMQADAHGPVMVCGFLGSVISLERAVALGRNWGYIAPLSAGLGSIVFILGLPKPIALLLFFIASCVLSLATIHIYNRQPMLFTRILSLGSFSWFIGNFIWLGGLDIYHALPWWICFLVFTIAGERLELSRFLPPSRLSKTLFIFASIIILFGAITSAFLDPLNVKLLSIGLIALSIWLIFNDIAKHTIKRHGQPRYMAICLLSGYLWLFAGGLIGFQVSHLQAGSSYDAFLHALLIGFTFCMIFAHALIILPAVTKIKVRYHSAFYLPLLMLHASLIIRIFGDVLLNQSYRSIGGQLNAVSLLIFALLIAISSSLSIQRSD